jgi:hypothetical protein
VIRNKMQACRFQSSPPSNPVHLGMFVGRGFSHDINSPQSERL